MVKNTPLRGSGQGWLEPDSYKDGTAPNKKKGRPICRKKRDQNGEQEVKYKIIGYKLISEKQRRKGERGKETEKATGGGESLAPEEVETKKQAILRSL